MKLNVNSLQKCDWCGAYVESLNPINEGDEAICDECYESAEECERCNKTVREGELLDGLCDCCYGDMH
jgi:uncharacterized paraquat-inducible protein A